MIIGSVKEIWRHPVKSMAGESIEECAVNALGLPGDRGWALRDEQRQEMTNGKRIPLLLQCAARYREEPSNGEIPAADITLSDGSPTATDASDIHTLLSKHFSKDVTIWPIQPPTNKDHYRRKKAGARFAGFMVRYGPMRSLLKFLTGFGRMNRDLRESFSREPNEPIPDISILPAEVLEFTSPLGTYFDAFPIHLLTTASLDAMAKANPSAQWDVRRFRPNFLIETNSGLTGLLEADWAGRTVRIGSVELKCEIPVMRCGMTMHAQVDLAKDPSVLRSIVRDANQNLGIYASVVKVGTVKIGDKVELI